MAEPTTKPGRGGRRAGAGRPPIGDEAKRSVTLALPEAVVRDLDAEARRRNTSRSQVATERLSKE